MIKFSRVVLVASIFGCIGQASYSAELEIEPSLKYSEEYKDTVKNGRKAKKIVSVVSYGENGSGTIVSEEIDGKKTNNTMTFKPLTSVANDKSENVPSEPKCKTQEDHVRLGSLCNK